MTFLNSLLSQIIRVVRVVWGQVKCHNGQLWLVLRLVLSLENIERLKITHFYPSVSYNCNQSQCNTSAFSACFIPAGRYSIWYMCVPDCAYMPNSVPIRSQILLTHSEKTVASVRAPVHLTNIITLVVYERLFIFITV